MAGPAAVQTIRAILLVLLVLPASAQNAAYSTSIDVVYGKPYVMVLVNGKGPFRFVIDTGTGAEALIAPALADRLDLPVAGQARLVDPSGQGERKAPVLRIDTLKLAGVDFKAVKAIRHNLAGEDGACMGLLGFALFRNFLLTLDYPNRQVILAHGSLSADGERSVFPMRMPDGIPLVPLRIDEIGVEAQLDSGGIGLSLPEPIASQLKFASVPVVYANGESLSTRFQVKTGKLGTDIHIGRYTFAEPVVEIHPGFPLANFGALAMQNFAITFDQQRQLVRLAAEHKTLHLDSMPSAIRLQNAPSQKPPNLTLIPIG